MCNCMCICILESECVIQKVNIPVADPTADC